MNISPEMIVNRSDNTVYRMVDGEAVIVEPLNGLVNVINEIGSQIWELIDGKRSAGKIAEIITSEYEVSSQIAMDDTLQFLAEMSEKKLVKIEH